MKPTREQKDLYNANRRKKMENQVLREEYNKKRRDRMKDKTYAEHKRKLDRLRWKKNKNNSIFKLRQVFGRIKYRCNCKIGKDYKHYGARGIQVLWKSFNEFKEDMLSEYSSFYKKNGFFPSIDRIDVNGHYCKENTRWCSVSENSRGSKRTSRYLTYKGRTMILADWARELGCSRQVIRYRLEAGWSDKQVIETSISHSNILLKNGNIGKTLGYTLDKGKRYKRLIKNE